MIWEPHGRYGVSTQTRATRPCADQPAQLYRDSGYLGSCENRGTPPPQPCDSLIPHMQKVEAQHLGFQIPTWPLLASILGKPHKKTSFGGKRAGTELSRKKCSLLCAGKGQINGRLEPAGRAGHLVSLKWIIWAQGGWFGASP